MKDLIEELKQNLRPYCVLSGPEKATLQSMPEGSLECLQLTSTLDHPEWYEVEECKWTDSDALNIFRVRANYEPVEDEYEMLTTADIEALEESKGIVANNVGYMLDTIRKQHDEIVRLRTKK